MTTTSTITFLGHSGLDLRLGAFRVVCDPWLTPRGAFLGRWNQFPDNGHVAAEALHDTPLLFVSSPRPDHFDAETLAAFPKTTRVLLPAFPSPALAERVRGLGFTDVVEVADGQPFELGPNASLEIIKGPTAHVFASTLVLSIAGEVVVNQNDCELDAARVARLAALAPAVHVASLSATARAAATYDVTPGPTPAQLDEQVSRAVDGFVAAARGVGARAVVVTGGAPCILDERGFELNFGGGLYTDAEALAARVLERAPDVGARLRLVFPGDVARREDGGWVIEGRQPYEDKRAYLEAYRARRAPVRERHLAERRAEAAPVDGKQLRSYLRDLFQFEDMTFDLGLLIQLHLSEGPDTWIDFRKKPYRYNAECDEAAGYVLAVDTAWASLVLQEKLTWHELLVAHEMTVRRAQERECPGLLAHLEFRHDPALFELVRRLNPATITIQDEKMEYVCQRFCPHRGRDLEYAIVERGVLTCTAHGWRFDLRKGGRCLWGGETPLVVKEVRPLKT